MLSGNAKPAPSILCHSCPHHLSKDYAFLTDLLTHPTNVSMNKALGLSSASIHPSGECLSWTPSLHPYPKHVLFCRTLVICQRLPRGAISPQNINIFPPDDAEGNCAVHVNPWIYSWGYFLLFPNKQFDECFIWCQRRVWCWTIKSDPASSHTHLSQRACFRHRKG